LFRHDNAFRLRPGARDGKKIVVCKLRPHERSPRQRDIIEEHNMNIGATEGPARFFLVGFAARWLRRIGAGRLSDVHVERAALADGAQHEAQLAEETPRVRRTDTGRKPSRSWGQSARSDWISLVLRLPAGAV
jgi:hypothetical protein